MSAQQETSGFLLNSGTLRPPYLSQILSRREVNMFFLKDDKTKKAIQIDCGTYTFDTNNPYDVELQTEYLQEISEIDLAGIIITHGHYDHWSLLTGHIHCPVFVDKVTHALIMRKASIDRGFTVPKLIVYNQNEEFSVGGFKITAIPTAHSIPGASMLLVRTPSGRTFFHTGDFKFNGQTEQDRFNLENSLSEIAKEGVDLMYCDNLSINVKGFTPTEEGVTAGISDIIAQAQGRVIIALFATSMFRLYNLTRASQALGKNVFGAGGSINFVLERMGLKKIEGYYSNQEDNVVIFASGCQAELDSVLQKEVNGADYHNAVNLRAGDTVILSSRAIPGNEFYVRKLVLDLSNLGCIVYLHEGEKRKLGMRRNKKIKEAYVHVSGHGSYQDVRNILEILRPTVALPSIRFGKQTETFSRVAEDLGIYTKILENNTIII